MQTPLFEALLGHGIIHNFIGRWKDPHDACEDEYFSVGWRFRRDGRINEALLSIYPSYPFSMDVVVMKFGNNGTIVPLRRMIDRSRVFAVVREYVALPVLHTWPYWHTIQVPRGFAQQAFEHLKTYTIVSSISMITIYRLDPTEKSNPIVPGESTVAMDIYKTNSVSIVRVSIKISISSVKGLVTVVLRNLRRA